MIDPERSTGRYMGFTPSDAAAVLAAVVDAAPVGIHDAVIHIAGANHFSVKIGATWFSVVVLKDTQQVSP